MGNSKLPKNVCYLSVELNVGQVLGQDNWIID